MVPPSSKKVFVLDTNVLLHDPNSILHFQEHDVVLPIVVIEEVDHFKKDQTEVGRNARSVSRLLDKLRATGSLSRGVPLDGGGTLKVDVAAHSLDIGILSADKHKADNQILACARELLHTCKDRVVLVTKDTNLRIKADAIGVHESTVSRATSNKYIQTPRGLFEMKYFFTTSIASGGLGEAHSAESVRHKIKQMIDAEDPNDVLSDDVIVTRLQQANIVVARRTVAKYRDNLRIPSSVDRRRLKMGMPRAPGPSGNQLNQ